MVAFLFLARTLWCIHLLINQLKENCDLFHRQQELNVAHICLVNKSRMGKISLSFLRLLCQDVALECMFSFDFPCSGKDEPFFGTGISLHFWHLVNKISFVKNIVYSLYSDCFSYFVILLLRWLGRQHHYHSFALQ